MPAAIPALCCGARLRTVADQPGSAAHAEVRAARLDDRCRSRRRLFPSGLRLRVQEIGRIEQIGSIGCQPRLLGNGRQRACHRRMAVGRCVALHQMGAGDRTDACGDGFVAETALAGPGIGGDGPWMSGQGLQPAQPTPCDEMPPCRVAAKSCHSSHRLGCFPAPSRAGKPTTLIPPPAAVQALRQGGWP